MRFYAKAVLGFILFTVTILFSPEREIADDQEAQSLTCRAWITANAMRIVVQKQGDSVSTNYLNSRPITAITSGSFARFQGLVVEVDSLSLLEPL